MTLVDSIANALVIIKNAEYAGKSECTIHPASKLISNILNVMKDESYIDEFEFIDDKGGKFIDRGRTSRVRILGEDNEGI